MDVFTSQIFVRILNKIPNSMLVKFGYSKIGSKIVNIVKKSGIKTIHEMDGGVKIYVDITNPRTWDLQQGTDPEKKIKQVFLQNISSGDTVIDVGANIGEFSLIASKKVGPSGQVIIIEPLPETVVYLKNNLLLNNFTNCSVYECAIGSKIGKMTMYKKNENATMGLLDPVSGEDKMIRAGEIEVKTIDDILSTKKISKVKMLKIDVEGHEYEVLLGSIQSLKNKKIDKILCEIHKKYLKTKGIDPNKIFSLLKEHGFSINIIEKDDDRPHILATLE